MKTKNYLTISAGALLLVAVACTKSKMQEQLTNEQPVTENHSVAHTIPLEAVKSMVENYEKALPNDTKSAWYSLSELTSFAQELKLTAQKNGVSAKDLGVRMYLSTYPQQQAGEAEYFNTIGNEYRNKLTFVMLPTYKNADVLGANGLQVKLFSTNSSATVVALNHASETVTGVQTASGNFTHILPLNAVKSMISTYETTRWDKSSNNTKSAWFPLDQLTSFIEEVSLNAKNDGLNTSNLGIRFYFSIYPEKQAGESEYFKSIENDYRNKLTFLMLPTYHDASSNVNVDILNKNGEKNSRSQAKAISLFTTENAASSSNHMALCPPACPN